MELNQKHSLLLASGKAFKWNAFSNCSFNNYYFFASLSSFTCLFT